MTSYAAKMVAKKLFKETSANKQGNEVCLTTIRLHVLVLNLTGSLFRDRPCHQIGRVVQDHKEEEEGSSARFDTRGGGHPYQSEEKSV